MLNISICVKAVIKYSPYQFKCLKASAVGAAPYALIDNSSTTEWKSRVTRVELRAHRCSVVDVSSTGVEYSCNNLYNFFRAYMGND